ncbi:hypothetical protein MAUB_36560 [Mycolicibacterium aubagnense]|uniref:Secreted protein n=1 Tax=Mycolicibacterium aubagnense TaxID=319707 RepID=A0ABM7IGI3_9MYCO|nr:hypothetical protein MAUB_36560 [Mycolicibacterium aubagnense]
MLLENRLCLGHLLHLLHLVRLGNLSHPGHRLHLVRLGNLSRPEVRSHLAGPGALGDLADRADAAALEARGTAVSEPKAAVSTAVEPGWGQDWQENLRWALSARKTVTLVRWGSGGVAPESFRRVARSQVAVDVLAGSR